MEVHPAWSQAAVGDMTTDAQAGGSTASTGISTDATGSAGTSTGGTTPTSASDVSGGVSTSAGGSSGGPPTVLPPEIPNLFLWLDADNASSMSVTGSLVDAWWDGQGSGLNALQTQPTAQPALVAGGIGGRDAVEFDGADWMTVWGVTQLSPIAGYTVCVVATAGGSDQTLLAGNSAATAGDVGYTLQTSTAGNLRVVHRAPFSQSPGNDDVPQTTSQPVVFGQPFVAITSWSDGNTHTLSVHAGGSESRTQTSVAIPYGQEIALVLGALSPTSQVQHLDGLLGEVLIYDRALSASERDTVSAYLLEKWGL